MSLRRRLVGLISGHKVESSDSPASTSSPSTSSPSPYSPEIDGEPDPGEVVWAWVPYEDDPQQGKDRPVLVLATEGDGWTGLMLSSQDHDRDAADEARHGRHWMDIGSGGWDPQGRPSEVRLDRGGPWPVPLGFRRGSPTLRPAHLRPAGRADGRCLHR